MNWDEIEGQGKEIRGEAKRQWGRLTEDDLARIEGTRDKLIGALQERYGRTKEEAEREVEDWLSRVA